MRLKKYKTRHIYIVGTSEPINLREIYDHVREGGEVEAVNFDMAEVLVKALTKYGNINKEEATYLIRRER